MSNPLIRKLSATHELPASDRTMLEQLCGTSESVRAGQDIIAQGAPPGDVHLVLDGFAVRYKILPDGRRQIVGVLLPGDLCDLHAEILGVVDHAIAALTDCLIVGIPPSAVRELTQSRPCTTRALWWVTLVEQSTLREWLANIGQRPAAERMAHFFCEMLVRLDIVGLTDGDSYALPLTQIDLADLFGLTSVHVNRTMRALRALGLVELRRRRITIPDVGRLRAFCQFDPTYLHLKPR